MCFSAQASFAASAALIAISALCFKKAHTFEQKLLAACPLLFGIQQFLEGIVWITLQQPAAHSALHVIGIYGFLTFAYMFWPVYVPYMAYRLEHNLLRKKIIKWLCILGGAVATTGCFALVALGFTARAVHHHIVYEYIPNTMLYSGIGDVYLQNFLLALYLIAIAGSLMISTVRLMWLLGLLIFVAFIVAQILYALAFGSVWCFFAALLSMLIYQILRSLNA